MRASMATRAAACPRCSSECYAVITFFPIRLKDETSDKSSKKVATQRPNAGSTLSVRSDRARAKLGRYVATKLEPSLVAT
ncbi:hypothetical protein F2Q68_00035170 [Brassica cretica]|uniref:Uncharacterized protein n=1 Tax=Brassica cretica TaxID=69181 RepID=A0A8S9H728_BRACR|nr:hypothetical protein F2Q68_00035170 [Brassica cretica]